MVVDLISPRADATFIFRMDQSVHVSRMNENQKCGLHGNWKKNEFVVLLQQCKCKQRSVYICIKSDFQRFLEMGNEQEQIA